MDPSSDGAEADSSADLPHPASQTTPASKLASLRDLALWSASQLDEEIQELNMRLGLKKKRRKELARQFGI